MSFFISTEASQGGETTSGPIKVGCADTLKFINATIVSPNEIEFPQGEQGPPGPPGPQGEQGPPGPAELDYDWLVPYTDEFPNLPSAINTTLYRNGESLIGSHITKSNSLTDPAKLEITGSLLIDATIPGSPPGPYSGSIRGLIYSTSNSSLMLGDTGAGNWDTTGNNTIIGGLENVGSGDNSLVVGSSNTSLGLNELVSGNSNSVDGSNNFSSGSDNILSTSSTSSVVSGTNNNLISGSSNIISGNLNILTTIDKTIASGTSNQVSDTDSIIASGSNNLISNVADNSFLSGNTNNIQNIHDSIVVGHQNTLSTLYDDAVIGFNNNVSSFSSSYVGGNNNVLTGASSLGSVIVGNSNNVDDYARSIVSGNSNNLSLVGYDNMISGLQNSITSSNTSVISGYLGTATDLNQSFLSGQSNTVNDVYNSIVSGLSSDVTSSSSLLSIANNSTITSSNGTIVTGENNTITSYNRSFISGSNNTGTSVTNVGVIGSTNTILSSESFIAGFGNAVSVTSPFSTILGQSNISNIDHAYTLGSTNTINSTNGYAIGKGNIINDVDSTMFGNYGMSNGYLQGNYFSAGTTTPVAPGDGAYGVIYAKTTGSGATGAIRIDVYETGNASSCVLMKWNDDNPLNEDRIGYFVSILGSNIQLCTNPLDCDGITSSTPCKISNTSPNDWNKLMRDEIGRPLTVVSNDAVIAKYIAQQYSNLLQETKTYVDSNTLYSDIVTFASTAGDSVLDQCIVDADNEIANPTSKTPRENVPNPDYVPGPDSGDQIENPKYAPMSYEGINYLRLETGQGVVVGDRINPGLTGLGVKSPDGYGFKVVEVISLDPTPVVRIFFTRDELARIKMHP